MINMQHLPSPSRPELLEQLWKARAEKKKLRKTIREFEEDFYQHNGRSVRVATSVNQSVEISVFPHEHTVLIGWSV